MLDLDNYDEIDFYGYWCLIRKLMYLACGTRPNIVFAVGQLNKQNADPRKGHFRAAKRGVRYLKGTIQMVLIYWQKSSSLRDLLPFGLKSYTDSNFAGDPKDRKSIMGYYFFLNGVVISWSSKKQRTISILTIKAKYIALGHNNKEAI